MVSRFSSTSPESSADNRLVPSSNWEIASCRLFSSATSSAPSESNRLNSALRSARTFETLPVASRSFFNSWSRLATVSDRRLMPSSEARMSSGVSEKASDKVWKPVASCSESISPRVVAADENASITSYGATVRSSGIRSSGSSTSVPRGSSARYFCPRIVLIWMEAAVSFPTQASWTLNDTITRSPSRSTPVTLPTFTPAIRTSLVGLRPAASLNSAL